MWFYLYADDMYECKCQYVYSIDAYRLPLSNGSSLYNSMYPHHVIFYCVLQTRFVFSFQRKKSPVFSFTFHIYLIWRLCTIIKTENSIQRANKREDQSEHLYRGQGAGLRIVRNGEGYTDKSMTLEQREDV